MPREFDGTTTYALTGVAGSLAGIGNGAISLAAIVKLTSTTTDGSLIYCGGGAESGIDLELFGGSYYMCSQDPALATASTSDGWHLVCGTKASGTVTPRFHKYVFSTGTWTHSNAGSTMANGVAAAGGDTLQVGRWGTASMRLNGMIQIAAVWDRALTDAEVELLVGSVQAWYASAPKEGWLLDQFDTSVNIVSFTGGGANFTGGAALASTDSGPGLSYGFNVNIPSAVAAASSTNANAASAAGTGTAQAATTQVAPHAGSAAGVGTGQPATTQVAPHAGATSGTGTASGVTSQVATGTGVAGSTGSAGGPGASVATSAGVGGASGSANGATSQVGARASFGAATGAALGATAQVTTRAGLADGIGVANAATATAGVLAAAGLATGVGVAGVASAGVAPSAGAALGTGSSLGVTGNLATGTGVAGGTGAAGGSGSQVGTGSGVAAGSGAAGAGAAQVAPQVGGAVGSGAAYGAAAVTGTVAHAGDAAGVGVANGVAALVAASGGSATAGGAAGGVTAGVGAGTGAPGGTGGAGSPGAAVAVTPAPSLGVGGALNATVQLQEAADAGLAAGSGVTPGAVVGASPSVGLAACSGAGLGATVTTSGAGAGANAQVAAGIGSALEARINITATAGVAAGVGTASQPSIQEEGEVHLYKFGPCEPWDATWPGGTCSVLLETGAAAVTGVALQAASEILYQLTAQRFGLCRVKLRPCRQSCSETFPWHQWWEYGSNPQPYWWAGTWYNLACGSCPGDSCSCVALEETTLPGPIYDVIEVKVNGVALTKNVDYRVDDYRKLVRLGGELWPFCQNMNLQDTEVDTWSVTADFGEVVPALGKLAVGELANEIAKYLLCLDCQLPQGVVDISRQGISMSIANISELFNTGFIQLRMCDLFIKTANPNHAQARSAVYDLDGPQHRAWGTTP